MSPNSPTPLTASDDTLMDKEERIRTYWMIEMLDSMTHTGATYDIGLSAPPINPILPCSDSVWGFPENAMVEMRPHLYSSALSLCILLACSELPRVHEFLRKPVMIEQFQERDAWQSEAQRLDGALTIWRDEFVAAVYRLINAEYSHHERPEMGPYIVLTNCVLNAAVIALLQRRAPLPAGLEQPVEPWAFASNRCIYACENMAHKIRQMQDEELLICHPHLAWSIFTAARFYIVHSKALDADVPINLHSLAFALHTCAKRWQLARVFETTILMAVAEHRTPLTMSKVPKEFYDLRVPTLDIFDSLKSWTDALPVDLDMTMEPATVPTT